MEETKTTTEGAAGKAGCDFNQENSAARDRIEKLLIKLKLKKDKEAKPTREKIAELSQSGKDLSSVGIELHRWPDFLKPWVVAFYNLYSNPKDRYENQVATLEGLSKGLQEIDKGITRDLWGNEVTEKSRPANWEIGGLSSQFYNFIQQRCACAQVVLDVDKEIGSAYQRKKDTDAKLTLAMEKNSLDDILAGQKAILTTEATIDYFGNILDDLSGELMGFDYVIEDTQAQINMAKNFKDYVRKQSTEVKKALILARTTGRETNYVSELKKVLPPLQTQIDLVLRDANALREENNKDIKNAGEITENIQLKAEGAYTRPPNPWEDQEKQTEAMRERALSRAKEIVQKPLIVNGKTMGYQPNPA